MSCFFLIRQGDMRFFLRIDYCGFGPSCSTRTKLLLSILLLNVPICIKLGQKKRKMKKIYFPIYIYIYIYKAQYFKHMR